MKYDQMVTGLLMGIHQLDTSSQGVSDVAISVELLENRKWPTSQIQMLSVHHHFHTAQWTVLVRGTLRKAGKKRKDTEPYSLAWLVVRYKLK